MRLLTILRILWQRRLKVFKTCNELPLKNFLNVMSTGDFKYLIKAKNHKHLTVLNTARLSMIWGDLVIEYGKIDNNMQISESFDSQKIIYQLEASYIAIKSMIRVLMFSTPQSKNEQGAKAATESIHDLSKLGYKIDTSDSLAYAKSIQAADKRANSILNQINIRKSNIDYSTDNTPISFDEVISSLNTALKFVVSDDITVARYCAYKKTLTKNTTNA